jgi:putative ABC transport system permease protein
MIRAATTLSTGHVNVAGFYKQTISDAAPVVLDVAKVRQIAEESTPGLAYIIDRQRGFAKFVSDSSSTLAGIGGIDPAQETRLAKALTLAPEKDYREGSTSLERKGDLSKLGLPGTIVIFANQAKKLEAGVGDKLTIVNPTLRGNQNSADVTIVAVCEDIGLLSMWSTFVAKDTIQSLYQLRPDTTGAVQIFLDDINQSDAVMGKLREAYLAKGYKLMDHESVPFWQKFQGVIAEDWTGQKLDITTWADEVSFLTKIITGVRLFGIFLFIILLVIIVIGIINTMWISVRERTGEIGTLRAVGMSQDRVLAMFLAEAGLLGVVAAGVGALVGGGVGAGITALHVHVPAAALRMILLSDTFTFSVSLGGLLGAVVLFTVVTSLSALWPSLRAARLQPVAAIQSVQ